MNYKIRFSVLQSLQTLMSPCGGDAGHTCLLRSADVAQCIADHKDGFFMVCKTLARHGNFLRLRAGCVHTVNGMDKIVYAVVGKKCMDVLRRVRGHNGEFVIGGKILKDFTQSIENGGRGFFFRKQIQADFDELIYKGLRYFTRPPEGGKRHHFEMAQVIFGHHVLDAETITGCLSKPN